MSGLKLTLPMRFTDTTLPVLSSDPVINRGSLALFEPAHPADPWAAGVPSSGYSIPNIASSSFAKLANVAVDQARGIYSKDAAITNADGVVKRTPKGGLEVVMSDTLTVPSGTSRLITMYGGKALTDYLVDNYGHSYFASVWKKNTRAGRSGQFPYIYAAGNEASQLNNIFSYQTSVIPSVASQPERYLWAPNANPFAAVTTSPGIWAIGVKNGGGTPNKSTFNYGYRWTAGNNSHSSVVYRIYLEDLTASGRTATQAFDADNAEFTKQVLTAGGRYFGDTFTDPTTVP